jgi:hypothetical protein
MNKRQKKLILFLLIPSMIGIFNIAIMDSVKAQRNALDQKSDKAGMTAGVAAVTPLAQLEGLSMPKLLEVKRDKENLLKTLEEELQKLKQAEKVRKLSSDEKKLLKGYPEEISDIKKYVVNIDKSIAFLKERKQDNQQVQDDSELIIPGQENSESELNKEDDDGMNIVSPEEEMEEEEKDFILYDVIPSFGQPLKTGELLAWGIPVPSIPTPRINKKSSSGKPADVPNQAEVSDETYNCLKSMEERSNSVTDTQVDQFLQGLNTAN